MTPALYLTGCIIITAALGWSLFAIVSTVRPSWSKIVAALTYSNKPERSAQASGPTRAHSSDCVGPGKGN